MFVIFDNVLDGRRDAAAIFQADEAGLLQDQERPAAIGNGYLGTVRQLIQAGNLFGINAHRFDVYLAQGYEVGAMFGIEFVHVGLVLEEVGIDFLVI